MIAKRYVSANAYLLDSFRLARQILDSGWLPDDLIALWRGGAPVGVAVHEFLACHGVRLRHRVLTCQSYRGIQKRGDRVVFDHADALFASVTPGSRVLVVDDVFDTGHTACAVLERLAPCGAEVRLATVYWKPDQNRTTCRPDYHLHETDAWIVFPHELAGLSAAELHEKDPLLDSVLVPERLTPVNDS